MRKLSKIATGQRARKVPTDMRRGEIRVGPQFRKRPHSFNHLVHPCKQANRHHLSNHLGRLEIDHEFVFGRCLDRKVDGLLALEKALDVTGRAPGLIIQIGPIATVSNDFIELHGRVDRGLLRK
jgi:hypothetical protein